MAKRILIDSSHPEETRVVVLSGNRVEDFDFETSSRKQLKGNIYLAKITRVEPSLQAAFVDYGGNRHGFLPFSEIHPDYYRIPIADREALLAEEAALRSDPADEAPDDVEVDVEVGTEAETAAEDDAVEEDAGETAEAAEALEDGAAASEDGPTLGEDRDAEAADEDGVAGSLPLAAETAEDAVLRSAEVTADAPDDGAAEDLQAGEGDDDGEAAADGDAEDSDAEAGPAAEAAPMEIEAEQSVDTVGGDEAEEAALRRAKLLRRYKIQEVIKRRQVILVQVTKEERGNKGAALTTYLSLPGRYCVLMPNTNKGGGISRKISNTSDRRRLKQILSDLEIPEGIAVIVRTAGSQRTKVEIRRDYEYLLRLWDSIRENTLQSTAPALIYEEANLIKRTIRDLYSRDMEEVLVDGDEGYKAAKDFMKSLTPSHAKKVQQYKDREVPLFQRHRVESQLDAMHSNTVQLRSGGYLVLNQTEALVAIDVNSGRATRERHIEETALKTNLEAAEEIGRQLRLRDLAGLIVIDFIDMEESRRNREVERRLKESLRSDRARIQLGRISPFGLLEMSRQRLRPSLFESSTEICPHCGGDGRVRTVESLALQVLRRLEEEGLRENDATIVVTLPSKVALYIFNHKRSHLMAIEQRHDFRITLETDDHLANDAFVIERDGVVAERRRSLPEDARSADGEDGDRKRGRRRSRRRRKDEDQVSAAPEREAEDAPEAEAIADEDAAEDREAAEQDGERQRKRKRRGKRGGRRRSRQRSEDQAGQTVEAAEADGSESESGEAETAKAGEAEARGETEAPESTAVGAATEEQSEAAEAPAGPEADPETDAVAAAAAAGAEAASSGDAAEAAEEKPKRRRATRQRRSTKKSTAESGDAATGEATGEAAEEAAEAKADVEAKPKRAPRRRGSTRTRTQTRSRGRKSSKADDDAKGTEDAAARGAPEETAGADEVSAAESAGATNGRSAEAAPPPGEPAKAASAQQILADDPKVVIERANPAASDDGADSPAEPPRSDEAQADAPKRRGWWNRFI
ncbi:Rne/Rng family ribonuclease [Pelagibius sp.]|uniref:Rne/Rng family ribonuclease n=1 Tax=Pelagibius sp. TaxID=1931238 RepID=UPI003B50B4F0